MKITIEDIFLKFIPNQLHESHSDLPVSPE